MSSQCKCHNDAQHQGHLCVLHGKGLTARIAELTDAPTVMCFSCGREANCAENVCVPMPPAIAGGETS